MQATAAATSHALMPTASDLELLSDRPRVAVLRGVLSREQCAMLIANSRDRVKTALVYGATPGSGAVAQVNDTSRRSQVRIVGAPIDEAEREALQQVRDAIGLPEALATAAQIVLYEPGGYLKPHYDFQTQRGIGSDDRRRTVTAVVYLNDDYEGGQTRFPRIGLSTRGETGDALVFANVLPSGGVDSWALHSGEAVTAGEKWVLVQWRIEAA